MKTDTFAAFSVPFVRFSADYCVFMKTDKASDDPLQRLSDIVARGQKITRSAVSSRSPRRHTSCHNFTAETDQPFIVVTDSNEDAEQWQRDLEFWAGCDGDLKAMRCLRFLHSRPTSTPASRRMPKRRNGGHSRCGILADGTADFVCFPPGRSIHANCCTR